MKLAFITTLKPQNGAFYGAETSLKYLIESLQVSNPTIEISIVIRQPFLFFRRLNYSDKIYIQNFFSVPVEKIHYTWLPYITFPIEKFSEKSIFRLFFTNIIILFNFFRLRKQFNKFDHVHINNTHLYLTKIFLSKGKYSQHVRDYIYNKKMFNTDAKFLICIDKTTYRQITNKLISKTHILPNLYIPKITNNIDEVFANRINTFNYVFCLVGQIAKIKGVDYVVKEFISFNCPESCLLVIGGVTDYNYFKKIKSLASQYDNIFFTGDVSNISEYYSLSNYNIRGDEHFCIGRTTIESAIQGLINILPLRENEIPLYESDSISDLIKKNTLYYNARQDNSLKQVLQNCINSNYDTKLEGFNNPSIEIANTFYSHILS